LCATLKDDTNDNKLTENERQNAKASAKSKELHPTLKANTMQHICFCPNAPSGNNHGLTERQGI